MITIKIILQKKPLQNGLYPIYLRLTKNRKSILINLKLASSLPDWNPIKEEYRKSKKNFNSLNNSLNIIKNRAENINSKSIAEGKDLTLDEFKNEFLNVQSGKTITLKDFWILKIKELEKANEIGNKKTYKEVMNSFFNFIKNEKVLISDITYNVIKDYEIYLKNRGNKDTSISVRMRTIRALFNYAIQKGFADEKNYPFKKFKISSLKTKTIKRSLSIENFDKIEKLDIIKYPHLANAKRYFLFSFYTGGMNFKDMVTLKWKDIQNNRIIYTRSKTKSNFNIKVLPPVQEILDYYKENNKNSDFVFPILLANNLTSNQIENRKDKMLKKYNRDLKQIASICNIESNLTSYVSRHSFATILKYKGATIFEISEAMGHKDASITQIYLKELEDSVIDRAMEKLL